MLSVFPLSVMRFHLLSFHSIESDMIHSIDRTEWNETKVNQVGSNHIRSDRVKSNVIMWNEFESQRKERFSLSLCCLLRGAAVIPPWFRHSRERLENTIGFRKEPLPAWKSRGLLSLLLFSIELSLRLSMNISLEDLQVLQHIH
jgi:hypothetical protein